MLTRGPEHTGERQGKDGVHRDRTAQAKAVGCLQSS
jgi:hypothetical protein